MKCELFDIFKRNFPFIIREDETVTRILYNPQNKVIEKRNEKGELIAVSVINKNTIYMLCVDNQYRNRGIGTELLLASERYVLEQGFNEIKVGAGEDYIMPGIPTNLKPVQEDLIPGKIFSEASNEGRNFFEKREYIHSWTDANCFDMKADFNTTEFPDINIGDTIDGIHYRWATVEDIPNIVKCTDDAEPNFSQFYRYETIYEGNNHRVLIGTSNGEVCSTLIVNIETEGKGIGSIGCTTVAHKYRGKHIGVNISILATKYLKDIGLEQGFLGYTYSGLDRMYGYAGYKICIYYYMGSKKIRF